MCCRSEHPGRSKRMTDREADKIIKRRAKMQTERRKGKEKEVREIKKTRLKKKR